MLYWFYINWLSSLDWLSFESSVIYFYFWLFNIFISAIYSAVLPPSVFARVDKPSPFTANLGRENNVFLIGIGGGSPSSESDYDYEDDWEFLFFIWFLLNKFSFNNYSSAYCSAVFPLLF